MIRTLLLLGTVTALVGCKAKASVPAPWDAWGVPSDHLVEIYAATGPEVYAAVYDQDPRGVVMAILAGLGGKGFATCGEMVITGSSPMKEGSPPLQATGFLKKDGVLWKVHAVEASADRTPVRIDKIPAATLSSIEANQAANETGWKAWHPELDRSGCLSVPTRPLPEPVPVAVATPVEPSTTVARPDAGDSAPSGDVPSRAKPRPPRAPAVQIKGGLSQEAVQQVVQRNMSRIRFCYERALATNADLAGARVVVKFEVDPSGAVTTASDGGSAIADPAVVECVAGSFKRMKFPGGGGSTTVVYPLRIGP